ncbi:MAG: hypothetical protein IIU39_04075 [Ruminococcus sp.]|nr:hypothetical protein [Ruminococcus sp.]
MKALRKITAAALAIMLCLSMVLSASAVTVEAPKSNHKIKEVVYYDKNPDPSAQDEMANYPAVWMLYDDPDNHTNNEVFVLKAVDTEEEAENKDMGIKGFKVDGKWYKVVALWTVNPDADIIDKGEGHKAVFTPLYYSKEDKPRAGETVSVALYDYDSSGLSNLVDVVIPEEGKETNVKVEEEKYCTITVHYVYAGGGQAAPDAVETCKVGLENYLINSPIIEGYTPDKNVVTGIPSGDKEETVTYSKNTEPASAEATTAPVPTEAAEGTTSTQAIVIEPTQEPTNTEPASSEAATDPAPAEATESTTSAQAVVIEPTQAPTKAEDVTVEPTKPNVKPTQEAVADPTTQPATAAEVETAAPTTPEVNPTDPAEELISIKDAKATVENAGAYTGKEKKPKVQVELDGKKLTLDTDYIVSYSNNKNAGKGIALIKGEGAYTDSITVDFNIAKADNPVKLKAKAITVKAKKLIKKKKAVKAFTLTRAKGKVTAKISKDVTSKKIRKKIKISSDGALTFKKGKYSKGTYKLKVNFTAKGNGNYNSKSITKTIKIKVT